MEITLGECDLQEVTIIVGLDYTHGNLRRGFNYTLEDILSEIDRLQEVNDELKEKLEIYEEEE